MAEEKSPLTTEEKPPVQEKQTNCLGCGKPLKKIKLYYRNGKYYCTKKCWRKVQKAKQKEETPASP
ncbi:MAG: hypothetical protein NC936_00945 [Candidatus Omnitrophica bacterium]|nr:hypothetical protein [Candidatus Omnitrophota bacterium]MCM8770423.1 hypothetical protein [Candidatus Omnitrophota bacterium]